MDRWTKEMLRLRSRAVRFFFHMYFKIFIETELFFVCSRTTGFQKVIQVYNRNVMNLPEN